MRLSLSRHRIHSLSTQSLPRGGEREKKLIPPRAVCRPPDAPRPPLADSVFQVSWPICAFCALISPRTIAIAAGAAIRTNVVRPPLLPATCYLATAISCCQPLGSKQVSRREREKPVGYCYFVREVYQLCKTFNDYNEAIAGRPAFRSVASNSASTDFPALESRMRVGHH